MAFFIIPLFAFANAGVNLSGIGFSALTSPITLGIIAALFFGNQIGIMSFSWLAVKLRITKLPENITWPQIYGVSILCGIGFTMSLFIAGLAFKGQYTELAYSRVGILLGSMLSTLVGLIILRRNLPA